MKHGNIIRLSIIIVGAILIVASVSVTVAYLIIRSTEITNSFVPAKIDCQVLETEAIIDDVVTKTSVTAQNTGNFEAYIRVRVVTYWEDSKGNYVARSSPTKEFGVDWKYNDTYWIYDRTNQTFYHKAPVGANEVTAELLKLGSGFDGIELEVIEDKQGSVSFTYHAVVEFIVEGIQAAPDAAVKSAWGVTLDSNGNITPKN
jgi:hypothetical protein